MPPCPHWRRWHWPRSSAAVQLVCMVTCAACCPAPSLHGRLYPTMAMLLSQARSREHLVPARPEGIGLLPARQQCSRQRALMRGTAMVGGQQPHGGLLRRRGCAGCPPWPVLGHSGSGPARISVGPPWQRSRSPLVSAVSMTGCSGLAAGLRFCCCACVSCESLDCGGHLQRLARKHGGAGSNRGVTTLARSMPTTPQWSCPCASGCIRCPTSSSPNDGANVWSSCRTALFCYAGKGVSVNDRLHGVPCMGSHESEPMQGAIVASRLSLAAG